MEGKLINVTRYLGIIKLSVNDERRLGLNCKPHILELDFGDNLLARKVYNFKRGRIWRAVLRRYELLV